MNRERRWGISFAPANLWLLTIAVTATALGGALGGLDDPTVAALAAVVTTVVMLIGMITWRGRTLLGWWGKRITYRKANYQRNAAFTSTNNVGHIWDGRCVSVYIEVLPQPYEVTVIGSESETSIRHLPIDVIREELVQFDITCEHVSIMTFAHKYAEPTKVATACQSALGPVAAMLYGRTVLEVTLDLDASLGSVDARQGRDDVTTGLTRTVTIAAERIRRRLHQLGWNLKLLDGDELQHFQRDMADQLEPLIAQDQWQACGDARMQAAVFSPASSAWDPAHYREWLKLNTHRHLEILHLARRRDGRDHAELHMGYLTDDASALATVRAIGLRPEYGQQAAVLSAAVPGLRTAPTTAVAGRTLAADEEFPLPMHPGGIGTFVGLTKTRAQVFVNFSVGASPFYVVAPAALCQQLMLGLSTSGLSIDIDIPGDEWRLFARRIGAGYRQDPTADLVLTTQEDLKRPARLGQARLIWMTSKPLQIDYGIVAGGEECAVVTPSGQIRYRWSLTNAEETLLTVPAQQAKPHKAGPPTDRAPKRQPDAHQASRPATAGRHAR